jgi:Dual specificity phosphatase, catalytic domain
MFLKRYWPLRAWRVYWLGRGNESPLRRPTKVENGLWVGGVPLPRRWRELQLAGVSRVVTLLGEAAPAPWLGSAESVLWLPVRDNHSPTVDQLRVGCAFLDAGRNGGPATLISCGAGIGRAATLYLAWRIATTGEPLEQALTALRRQRPIVDPTRRQMESLRRWEEDRQYLGQLSEQGRLLP